MDRDVHTAVLSVAAAALRMKTKRRLRGFRESGGQLLCRAWVM